MIQANESGNPKTNGVAEEYSENPGQINAKVVMIITTPKMIRDRRIFTGPMWISLLPVDVEFF